MSKLVERKEYWVLHTLASAYEHMVMEYVVDEYRNAFIKFEKDLRKRASELGVYQMVVEVKENEEPRKGICEVTGKEGVVCKVVVEYWDS